MKSRNSKNPTEIRSLQEQLLSWFTQHQRDLPWRRTYDPYQVWISEIMLQQTQVKTVLPYFDRWMNALPTIEAVAHAPEDFLLKLWEGLGYYSRARNIQKAARQILEHHGGNFPSHYNDILKLPGIGRYTAGAIASIAFNQEAPIVDGNIIRLIARLLNRKENTKDPQILAQIWEQSEAWIPKGQARDFNQSMMELGALICTPKNPDCGRCPVQSHCEAYAAGTISEIPNRGVKAEKIPLQVAVAILESSNKIFIQKRGHKGLMAGLWEFPGGKIEPHEQPEEAVKRELLEELGIQIGAAQPFMRIKHAYTRYVVDLHCFRATPSTEKFSLQAAVESKWVTVDELSKFAFPAANVKIIQALKKALNSKVS